MKDLGKFGEDTAVLYLKKKHYKILARNYRVRKGEMDIVAYRHGILVCVEVKTRSSYIYGDPRDAVDEEKIRRFNAAKRDLTDNYLKNGRIPVSYKFFTLNRKVFSVRNDIIEIIAKRNGEVSVINHIKDAFK